MDLIGSDKHDECNDTTRREIRRKCQSGNLNGLGSFDGSGQTLQEEMRTSLTKKRSHVGKSSRFSGTILTLTTTPFCWAERDSRMEKTPPPTDTSRHMPHFASPPQKEPRGCMMRTPFVVRPSISRFSCHFVAFSCKEQFKVIKTHS